MFFEIIRLPFYKKDFLNGVFDVTPKNLDPTKVESIFLRLYLRVRLKKVFYKRFPKTLTKCYRADRNFISFAESR